MHMSFALSIEFSQASVKLPWINLTRVDWSLSVNSIFQDQMGF